MKYGLCCIVLELEPKKFKKITYKRFSQLDRQDAIKILSERILNNIDVTYHAIQYCQKRNYCYRLSSDLFPLITYDKANVSLEDLPDYQQIIDLFKKINNFISATKIRVSCHPSEFTVLASKNTQAVSKTIRELNFYSWFMDQIGCDKNHNSPMNLHINNNEGEPEEIIDRLVANLNKLDSNCRNRITIENDDKINCWSVNKLIKYYHSQTNLPICFDYLHHKCHPDGLTEQQAVNACYDTWNKTKPLFHYSESREGKNPRRHADYPSKKFDNYGLDFDIDFELKMKDKAINHYVKEIAI